MLTTTTLQFCGVVFGWTLYDVLFVVKTTVRISREVWHTRDSKREVRMRQYLDLLRDIRDNGEEKATEQERVRKVCLVGRFAMT